MPPPRQSTTRFKQRSRKKNHRPETDDEWLSEAVNLEEAAEKWRAGDSEKAARFYGRAIRAYEDALKLFPHSFDLTYNKARLQFEITQMPSICENLSASEEELLLKALQSHRNALEIESRNADLLFNTAQVLTSIAECTENDKEATQLLQEAVMLFHNCFDEQKKLYQESLTQAQQLNQRSPGDVSADTGLLSEPRHDTATPVLEWATLEEPVTPQSLIDTAVAMLGALSTSCTLVSEPSMLSSVVQSASHLDELVTAQLGDQTMTNTSIEMICARAKFQANVFEAEYRLQNITYSELDIQLQDILKRMMNQETKAIDRCGEVLLCCADVLISFATARADVLGAGVLRYKRLTMALELLAEAAKLPEAKDVAATHMARGDVEMFRLWICQSFTVPESIRSESARATLLGNAATFYSGAAMTAQAKLGLLNRVTTTADIKKAVVDCICLSSNEPLADLGATGTSEIKIRKVVANMVEDSLVREETLQHCAVL